MENQFKDDGNYVKTADGTKIYYEDDGKNNKEAILFIPGVGSSEEIFNYVSKILSEKYRIIKLDGRGIGLSDMPDGPYSISLFAEDLTYILKDLNIDSLHLAGHSLGGMVAQEFYNLYPQKVKSLILISTMTGFGDSHSILPKDEDLKDYGLELNPSDPELAQKIIAKTLSLFHINFVKKPSGQALLREFSQINLNKVSEKGIKKRGEAALNYKNFENLKKINCPCLILHGQDDKIVPFKNGEILHKEIKNSIFKPFLNCGHLPFMEELDLFCNYVDDFISDNIQ